MKKYWIFSAAVIIVIGTTFLLVLNKDNKEKAGEPAQIASGGGEMQAALAANKANPKFGENEEIIEDIKRKFNPEWDKVNQAAEKRLSELINQAQKEYKIKKDSSQDLSRLEGKYLGIFNRYEQSIKEQVESIISNVQKEAIAKELNNNIGEEYFELYRIQKEKRIEKIVNELKKLS
ncbi:hypothetical protein ABLO26_26040 [Neobacillus sp. 179-J 1A1 HS]|uniref:hypothetical protein n=1 Tax=Neobacillus driksii TaxID=3035913 RepID=UPI0035BC0927